MTMQALLHAGGALGAGHGVAARLEPNVGQSVATHLQRNHQFIRSWPNGKKNNNNETFVARLHQ